jgi:hypothetical protein
MTAALCSSVVGLSSSTPSAGQAPARPLLQRADLIYVGAFRLPAESINQDDFSFGGAPIAFNPVRSSLFVGSRRGNIAELILPAPVASDAIADLPFATYMQGFADPTEGHVQDAAPNRANPAGLDGLLVSGARLYGSAAVYYDASNDQRRSHFARSLALNESSFSGLFQVWDTGKTGYVSGYLADIPAEWQPLLGGPAITGQCCIPIVSRTSYGPSAFAWNPADLTGAGPVRAQPLLYYPGDHPLSAWDGTSAVYNGSTEIRGAVIPEGTRTLLFVGRQGTGPFCYGDGGANGECKDPVVGDKGTHAYPYRYQIWAYDLADLADVRAGRRSPWDVHPYDVWPLDLPIDEPAKHLGGVTYDAAHHLLYVSQMLADRDEYAFRPLIHVFRIP